MDSIYMIVPFDCANLLFTLDSDAINKWKSDTLRAYANHAFDQDQVHKECNLTAGRICKYAKQFNFKSFVLWWPKRDRLLEQIVKPAVDLSIKMSCAPEQYRWNWYIDSKWYFDGVVSKRDLGKFTLIDVLTHQKIRESKFANLPDDAKIGSILLVMYPALFRCGKDGQNDIQIEKAVILIHEQALSKPKIVETDQKNVPSNAPGASDSCSNATKAADEDLKKCEEEL